MLGTHCEESFEQLVDSLPIRIQLTDALRESLENERGASESNPFEMRRSARFRCNGQCVVLVSRESFTMPNQDRASIGIVRDVSRTGVGMISHQQLFPEQLVEVLLNNAKIVGRIARARKLGANCFEIGITIIQHQIQKD